MTIGPRYHVHYYVCTLTQYRCVGCHHVKGTPQPAGYTIIEEWPMWMGFVPEHSDTPIYDKLKASINRNSGKLILPDKLPVRDEAMTTSIEEISDGPIWVCGTALRGLSYGTQTENSGRSGSTDESTDQGPGRIDPEPSSR